MSDSPWFPFYAGDFTSSTSHYDAEAIGTFVFLLCVQWDHGKLPIDLTNANQGRPVSELVAENFPISEDGFRRNQRLEGERGFVHRLRGQSRWVRLVEARKLGTHSSSEWDNLKGSFDGCAKCGSVPVTKDHIVPISKGGSDSIDNIQPLCRPCNSSKKDRTIDYRKGAK